jgi:hypothetical protein
MLYSKSTNGFYDTSIHGSQTILIVDPSFDHPQIEVQNDQFDPEDSMGRPTYLMNNPEVEAPLISVPNPDCKIPADAVEITDEQYQLFFSYQSENKEITFDVKTKTFSAEHKIISEKEKATFEIQTIEASITPRRNREAVLGTDKGWLVETESKITELRKKLK